MVDLFDDIDDKVSVFNILLEVYAPIKSVRGKKNPAPWILKPIQDEMDRRNGLLKLHRRNSSSFLWAQFKAQRNHVVFLQRQAKKEYFLRLTSTKTHPSTLWKSLKLDCRNDQMDCWSSLNTDHNTIANALNDHFVSVSSKASPSDVTLAPSTNATSDSVLHLSPTTPAWCEELFLPSNRDVLLALTRYLHQPSLLPSLLSASLCVLVWTPPSPLLSTLNHWSVPQSSLPNVLPPDSTVHFADDTSIYIISDSLPSPNSSLQLCLNLANQWKLKNSLKLNTLKSKCVLIHSSWKNVDGKLELFVDNLPIEQVRVFKFLGVLLKHTLTWSDHIAHICTKVSHSLNLLRHLS